ncbi:aspartyl-phosphate phosphatase Spo0E family protein [Priestia abyssalis]|uniref:aspartyl-phosphate phosphatase Spo0E family protein n=1 Tax=Priestia abyssalis TaxID=1221450 RepID=UPI0009956A28|nr:aspartyl-phosphate phosphatase Spo0E family protein [Priestia abyssalis]
MSTVIHAAGRIEGLIECIVKKRKELIDLGKRYGLLDEKTIRCSQDLDELINLHIKVHSSSTNTLLDNETDISRMRHSYDHYKVSNLKYGEKAAAIAISSLHFFSAQVVTNFRSAALGVRTALSLISNSFAAGFAVLQVYR